MIHLHTGLPGAGKTLCTLVEVKERAEREKRPVYYSGIADLRLPWTELDKGEDWHTVPDGALVVVDEGQRCFRPRHTASTVPEHVSKLETHRHHGLDLYIVTQHPKLIDTNVRRLVGKHVHFVRAFGAKAVTRHEWGEVREDPQSRDDSQRQLVPYPADAFKWYHSAEVHTHKRQLPRAVWALAVLPVLVGGLGWYAWNGLASWADRGAGTSKSVVEQPGGVMPNAAPGRRDPGKARLEWLVERDPRVAGLAYTAPVYDKVTQVTDAPYPAVCISTATRCVCYSQQGTRLDVADALCRQFAARGFFKDWGEKSQGDGARVAPHAEPQSGPESAPIVSEGVVPALEPAGGSLASEGGVRRLAVRKR